MSIHTGIGAWLCLCLIFSLDACMHEMRNASEESAPIAAAPAVEVEAFEFYFRGFPMIVAVTCRNPTENRMFGNLPKFNLMSSSAPVEFIFLSEETGREFSLPFSSTANLEVGQGAGFYLPPGESRRMLFDISELEPAVVPGRYRLKARYHREHGYSESASVLTDIVEPSATDRSISTTLRQYNDRQEPSWIAFLRYNWRTIHISDKVDVGARAFPRVLNASGLSTAARDALALHLFLHRAIYGPKEVADLNLKNIDAFDRGLLRSEAAVLRYEILHARGDSVAEDALGKEVLADFPGVAWRLEEIREGFGRISYLRRTRGAGREFDEEPEFLPYVEPY